MLPGFRPSYSNQYTGLVLDHASKPRTVVGRKGYSRNEGLDLIAQIERMLQQDRMILYLRPGSRNPPRETRRTRKTCDPPARDIPRSLGQHGNCQHCPDRRHRHSTEDFKQKHKQFSDARCPHERAPHVPTALGNRLPAVSPTSEHPGSYQGHRGNARGFGGAAELEEAADSESGRFASSSAD
ncbi:hypothetical protein OE88DRAFT_144305 [Heliocybe sulcata]|uniref:Uncharacterized protein n=1 Tax=Heliocybe sulcata TaxID=5364 RepID=A0A5C3NHX8_9AGAM|nr:hypothetical protein OE88DRAFT_144305 [Heliocybe sulcata]